MRRFGGREGATRALWDRSGIVAVRLDDASARTVVVARRVSHARNRGARGSASSETDVARGAVTGRAVPMARRVARIARDGWRLPKWSSVLDVVLSEKR